VERGLVGEGLGRCRGGFTPKLDLSAEGRCRPLSLVVTPGQRADCTQLDRAINKIRVPRTWHRRSRKLKHSRAVATRYDKRGYVCLGTVIAAALVI
jgi:hypothetical protein